MRYHPSPMLTGTALIDDINACQVSHKQCAYWWLGQHGFAVKLGRAVLYIDPYISPDKARQIAPIVKAEEITNATLVLGTHDHSDHIDRPAWPAIASASPKARFIVPKMFEQKISRELSIVQDRVLGVDQEITVEVDGITVTAIPAEHEFLDIDPKTGLHPYVGYIIQGNGMTLYHAGDTCVYEGMQGLLRQWKLDLAFLPINGRDARRYTGHCAGNMTFQEAVDLAGTIKPGMTVPTHFEMFAMNSENPQLFVDYLQAKYPGVKTQIPVHGQRTMVSAG